MLTKIINPGDMKRAIFQTFIFFIWVNFLLLVLAVDAQSKTLPFTLDAPWVFGYSLENFEASAIRILGFTPSDGTTSQKVLPKFTVDISHKNLPQKIRIATSIGSAPFHFSDSNGLPKGMFIDLWQVWSDVTGIEIEFVPSSWSDTLKNIRQGEADIHAGLFKSVKRKSYLDYGVPLHKAETHFFYHKSLLGINDLEDLIPFKIGVIEGDFALEFIRKRLPGLTLSIYRNNRFLFDAVEAGEIKVFIKDTPIARYHLSRHRLFHEFRFHSSRPLYTNTFHVAVKKGNSNLLQVIKQGMDAISGQQKAEIQRKWMGVSETKTKDVIVIALPENNMPFSGIDFAGKPTGMLVDIWRMWSQKTGLAIEFKVADKIQTRFMVEKGDADIHAGLVPSSVLEEKFIFSQPFYRIATNLFYKSDLEPCSVEDILKRQKIGISKGSYYSRYLNQKAPSSKPEFYSDHQTMVKSALANKIQYFLYDTPVALELLDQLEAVGQFKYDPKPIWIKSIHAAVKRENNKLIDQVDQGLSQIQNRDIVEIEERWIKLPALRQMKGDNVEIRLTRKEKQWLEKHQHIRLGVDPDWPPFDYLGKDGKVHKGMASDFIRLLNQRLGMNMKIASAFTWQDVIKKAKNKEIDVIACLTETDERKKYLEFTEPYLSFPMVIITRDDYEFVGSIRDLYGKRVAIVKQYAIHNQLKKSHADLPVFLYDSPLEGLMAVSMDKVDAYIGNLVAVSHLIQRNHIANVKVAAPAGLTKDLDQLKLGVRKDWPILASILNKGLVTITEKEKTDVQQRWFSVRFEHGIDIKYVQTIVVRGVAVFIVILAVILFWNRRLKAEINRRVRAEAELRKLTLAVEQSPASVVITNSDGFIEYVNPRFTIVTGYSLKQIKASSPRLFETADLSDETRKRLMSNLRSGEIWQGDMVNRKKNGITFWESVLIAPIIDQQELITHYVAVSEDITERKQSEEDLLKARDAAEAANRSKSVFLSNMSHEIRTPMNAILGFSQVMLRDSTASDEQKENLRTIWRSGEHLLELINNILEMSKIEAGRTTLNFESFDLHSLINDIEMMLKVQTNTKNIWLSVEMSDQVPQFIRTDQGKLRQMLINLVGNAVKFTEKGGVILRLYSKMDPEMICFEIEDTGPGIPDSELENIFQQFEQTAEARKVEGGTGLGLAISKNYAVLMKGDINVTSKLGHGSIFRMEIPFDKANPEEIELKNPKQRVLHLKSGQKPIRVLIADDQDTNRKLMAVILSKVGFDVDEAENGEKVVEKFKSTNPHLILMDLVMPVMDGLEATKIIKKLPGGDKVVIFAVTASVLEDEQKNVIACGAAEFIHKPFREAELFQKIEQHLQVEFEFENRRNKRVNSTSQTNDSSPLTQDLIRKLPEDLLKQLHHAALNGYRKQLTELIEKIEPLNANVANQMKQLIQQYNYEKIVELLDDI